MKAVADEEGGWREYINGLNFTSKLIILINKGNTLIYNVLDVQWLT